MLCSRHTVRTNHNRLDIQISNAVVFSGARIYSGWGNSFRNWEKDALHTFFFTSLERYSDIILLINQFPSACHIDGVPPSERARNSTDTAMSDHLTQHKYKTIMGSYCSLSCSLMRVFLLHPPTQRIIIYIFLPSIRIAGAYSLTHGRHEEEKWLLQSIFSISNIPFVRQTIIGRWNFVPVL